mmetsp:Transcript_27010/g.41150  ORF Transcript_27010/g.41150 Transcript_27010/m.41150 type:complete len:93 (+) Transcript_27010:1017-1295(+)
MVPKTAVEVKFEELRRASELTLENVSSAADDKKNKVEPLSSSSSNLASESNPSSSSSRSSEGESSSRDSEEGSPQLNINESLTQPPLFINLQ